MQAFTPGTVLALAGGHAVAVRVAQVGEVGEHETDVQGLDAHEAVGVTRAPRVADAPHATQECLFYFGRAGGGLSWPLY